MPSDTRIGVLGERSSALAVQAGGQRPGARTEVWLSQRRHDRGLKQLHTGTPGRGMAMGEHSSPKRS